MRHLILSVALIAMALASMADHRVHRQVTNALVIANNTSGLVNPGGVAPDVVIPVVGITQAVGAALRATLTYVELRRNYVARAGTVANYPRQYAPTAFAQGSSVSHWDATETPSMLMEPFITSELTSSVKNPEDLSRGGASAPASA